MASFVRSHFFTFFPYSWSTPPLDPSDHLWSRGGRPRIWKKSEKIRFYKTCHTLTTIQPRKKMQLTKVVSPPKRFGGPLKASYANRSVASKSNLFGPPHPPHSPHRLSVTLRKSFFRHKKFDECSELRGDHQTFWGRKSLSKLSFRVAG